MTKFHDMPEDVREFWLAWADRHDWGGHEARWTKDLQTGETALHVECAFKDEHGDWGVESFLAHSPKELRAWAGY